MTDTIKTWKERKGLLNSEPFRAFIGVEWEMQAEIDALRTELARQESDGYMHGFNDGMKEAPTGECWIRAIDEAMVGAHIGVANIGDDYGTAKEKLNSLICWSVEVDRELSKPSQQAEQASCEWKQDPDFEMGDTYHSSCGELWSFIDGGPKENRVSYCHHCGKPVKMAAEPKGGV